MPDKFIVDVPDLTQFGVTLSQSAAIFLQEFERGMNEALPVLEAEITGRTPVNVGFLRATIGHKIYGEPATIRGEVFVTALYGAPVEYGREPGKWPPRDQIELWVRRKLGISNDKEARSVAFLISRSIGRHGTTGAFMFRDGFDAALPAMERIFDASVDRAMDRLTQ